MDRTSLIGAHRRITATLALAGGTLVIACTGLTACGANSSGGGSGGGFSNPNEGNSQSSTAGNSAAPSGTGTSSTSGNGGSGGTSGTSGATGTSSGGTGGTSGSADAGTASSSGGTTKTGAADASSTTAAADSGTSNGIPTAPGISVGPTGATDLAVPPSSVGVQYATPAGMFQVTPGDEIFPNYCVTVPNAIEVGGFQSWMSEGSSHHFILYRGGTAAPGAACALGANDWMYASSTPGQVVTENFPANVGLSVAASTQLILNLHFINTSSTTEDPQVKINLLYATDVKYQAGTMASFNTSIDVPAATAAGPGTQTVSGTCTAPAGANFFTISTHTHKHATAAWVDYNHNGVATEIVHTGTTTTYPADQEVGSGTDWEHPGVGLWTAPNFLQVQAGDSFTYHCSYSNTASTAVTVGETACCNEMCMAIGYYFPAGSTSCD